MCRHNLIYNTETIQTVNSDLRFKFTAADDMDISVVVKKYDSRGNGKSKKNDH
ncbi:hypothetical protein [Paenibacillus pini]|uniref:Uncharacterized protein n=1 Tax=Paenibacillus pini JCM 16418 TaxID=1236976 RepID=W7YEN8_9BACL|nr:hypothetical protein JCM16418_3545 [Paenibacillus pini JCM 16418]